MKIVLPPTMLLTLSKLAHYLNFNAYLTTMKITCTMNKLIMTLAGDKYFELTNDLLCTYRPLFHGFEENLHAYFRCILT